MRSTDMKGLTGNMMSPRKAMAMGKKPAARPAMRKGGSCPPDSKKSSSKYK